MSNETSNVPVFLSGCLWLFLFCGLPTLAQNQENPDTPTFKIELTQTWLHPDDSRGLQAVVAGLDPDTLEEGEWRMEVIDMDQEVLYFQLLDTTFDSFFVFNPGVVGSYQVVLRKQDPLASGYHRVTADFAVVNEPLMHVDRTRLHPSDPWGISIDFSGLDPTRHWSFVLERAVDMQGVASRSAPAVLIPDAEGVAQHHAPTPSRMGQFSLRLIRDLGTSSETLMRQQIISVSDQLQVRGQPGPVVMMDAAELEAKAFGMDPLDEAWLMLRPSYGADPLSWPSGLISGDGGSWQMEVPNKGGAYTLELHDASTTEFSGEPLAEQQVLVVGGVQAPNAPTNLVGTAISSRQVFLDWDHDGQFNPTFWHCRKVDNWNCNIVIGVGTSYTVNFLQPDTDYMFRVYALNGGGQSPDSNVISVRTPPPGPPQTPTGVTAHIASNEPKGVVRWQFNDPNGDAVDGYRVYGQVNGGNFTLIRQVSNTTAVATQSGLLPGTMYGYQVTAFNSHGESEPSSVLQVTTDPAPPMPTDLRVINASANHVQLGWAVEPYCCDRKHEVQRREPDVSTSTWTTLATVNLTNYTDHSVNAVTRYRYRVRSCRFGDNPDWCSDVSSVLPITTPDYPPGRPTVHARAQDWQSVRLEFTPAAPGPNSGSTDSYKIERSEEAPNQFQDIGQTSDPTFTDTGLDEETRYYYRVTAINNSGSSTPTTTSALTTPVAPPPSVPINVVTTPINGTRVRVDFAPGPVNIENPAADKYAIALVREGTTLRITPPFPASMTSFTMVGLEPLTTYEFQVEARGVSGISSGFSEGVPGTTLTMRVPGRPIEFEANVLGERTIELSWSRGAVNEFHDPPVGYQLQRSVNNELFVTIATIESTRDGEFTDTELEPGTEYRYRVRAENAAGFGPFAGPITAETEAPPPEPDLACTGIRGFYANRPRTYVFHADLEQLGTGPIPPHKTLFYVSFDDVLDPDDIEYPTTGTVPFGRALARIWFPQSVAGPVYIIVKVDAYDQIEETNENNNICVLPFDAPRIFGPDLVIDANPIIPTITMASGGSFAVPEFAVVNQGTSSAAPSELALGLRPVVMPEQLAVLATEITGGLNEGERQVFPSQNRTFSLPPGTYHLVAIADFITDIGGAQAVLESDENNNERVLAVIEIQ